jgi:hypothetical protein
LSEDIKVDNTIDKHTESKKEQKQLQRIVHKVSIKNLDAWFGTKQALKRKQLLHYKAVVKLP